MSYAGNIALGDTIDIKFSTVSTAGVPTTLAGTPVVSAYSGNSTTQLTAGITLTVDFDGVTGLHNVRVVATVADGYTTRTNYTLVITTGTVGGSSVVGYVVGAFSIGNRIANSIHSGVATAGAATSITLAATASTTADLYNGAVVHILAGTGAGQQRSITAYSTGRVATVDTWVTNPDNTSQYVLLPGSSSWEGEAGPTADEIGDDVAARTLNANIVSAAADSLDTGAFTTDLIADIQSGLATSTSIGDLPTAAENATALLATALFDTPRADGAAATVAQAIVELMVGLGLTKIVRSGTTLTGYKFDESTTYKTWTLDSATTPTTRTSAS